MYISSRRKQQTLANCDHDISICDSKIQVSSVEKLVILSAGMLTVITLLKKCNSYLFLLSIIKVFLSRRNRILYYNSYILPHLDLCCIIWGNCSSTLEDKLVKFQKRTARVILDCDFYTPSSELLTYHVEILDLLTVNNYIRQKPNCELFRKSFMYSGAAIWNSC